MRPDACPSQGCANMLGMVALHGGRLWRQRLTSGATVGFIENIQQFRVAFEIVMKIRDKHQVPCPPWSYVQMSRFMTAPAARPSTQGSESESR